MIVNLFGIHESPRSKAGRDVLILVRTRRGRGEASRLLADANPDAVRVVDSRPRAEGSAAQKNNAMKKP